MVSRTDAAAERGPVTAEPGEPWFAQDADRLARFEREAKTLATLNHPNIAAIYGIEQSGDAYALVMELVEGSSLADRIAQGAPNGPVGVPKFHVMVKKAPGSSVEAFRLKLWDEESGALVRFPARRARKAATAGYPHPADAC